MKRLYLFGWPGPVGGASTKFDHLIRLLHRRFPITVVPNDGEAPPGDPWHELLRALPVEIASFDNLPARLHGWGLALCNFPVLAGPVWREARRRGLRMAWSNEMMWTKAEELGAILFDEIDVVLYASPTQRLALEPAYRAALTGALIDVERRRQDRASEGWIQAAGSRRKLRWVITGNYIDPALFPSARRVPRRPNDPIVVGRLSRADPGKFPADFPMFYEGLGLRNPRFRVMAWDEHLARRWPGHEFDHRWDLLPAMAENPSAFLQTLDLFVYEVGSQLQESWGRSVVEAMLSGAVPLVPAGTQHHLRNLVEHGRSGFACASVEEFGRCARLLESKPLLLKSMSRSAREFARQRLCRRSDHLRKWERVFVGL